MQHGNLPAIASWSSLSSTGRRSREKKMIENTILKANREGRKALVFSMTYKDLWAVEAAAQVGFDAISLDGEHGAFSSSDIDDIVCVAMRYGMLVMARDHNL